MKARPFFINETWYVAWGIQEAGPHRQLLAKWYWNSHLRRWVPLFSAATAFDDEHAALAYIEQERECLEAPIDR